MRTRPMIYLLLESGYNLLIIFFLASLPAFSQNINNESKQSQQKPAEPSYKLFDSSVPLEVTLRFDITDYLKKTLKSDSFIGVMTMHLNETDSITRDIVIKYRGISRYQNCDFPPIQINIKKPLLISSDSSKIKKLKLVTHCEPGSQSDEYVLREYLVYKLYNILTDTSFRVRLLKLNYIDTKRNRKPIKQYGIFIEPIELLAKRANSYIVNATSLTKKDIFPKVMDRVAIFNYMISNWDWSVAGQHNIAVIKSTHFNPEGLGVAVPYDFDLTGVVNADYAVPPPDLGIEKVRDRLFAGLCLSREEYRDDLKFFLSRKEKLYSEINSFEYLNQRSKKDITNFLDQFFVQLEKQKSMDNLIDLFLNSCKR